MSATRPDIDTHPRSHPASDLKTHTYNVIIIGGGTAGLTAASRLVIGGFTVLVVKSKLVGGECGHWACIPSQTLLHAAEAIRAAQAVSGARQKLELLVQNYGEPAKPEVDLNGMWVRRDMFAHNWQDDAMFEQMGGYGIEIVHGFGSFSGMRGAD